MGKIKNRVNNLWLLYRLTHTTHIRVVHEAVLIMPSIAIRFLDKNTVSIPARSWLICSPVIVISDILPCKQKQVQPEKIATQVPGNKMGLLTTIQSSGSVAIWAMIPLMKKCKTLESWMLVYQALATTPVLPHSGTAPH